MSEKVVGYILLCTGILLIIISLFSGYNLFTKATNPIRFFDFGEITITLPSSIENQGTQFDLSQEITLPNTIEGPINMATQIFFLAFFVSVGTKVANIGTNLIRPIIIKGKTENEKHSSLLS